MDTTNYTEKDLKKEARLLMQNYRSNHKGKYIFAEIPWFITATNSGLCLTAQIKNRDTGWTENVNIAL